MKRRVTLVEIKACRYRLYEQRRALHEAYRAACATGLIGPSGRAYEAFVRVKAWHEQVEAEIQKREARRAAARGETHSARVKALVAEYRDADDGEGIDILLARRPEDGRKVAIHLYEPSRSEFEDAIDRAHRDGFETIVIHTAQTWPGRRARRGAS